VAGDFDLDEFAQFARFADRVESRPFVDWRLLPSEIARVDVNLIPLHINLFTEAKSNLKYYEAGLLKIPSVASPTRAFASSITQGVNGMLADTSGEWYDALRSLILDPRLRSRLGERAYEHVLETYVPEVVAGEARAAYCDLIVRHRRRLGIPDESPSVTILMSDLVQAVRERSSALELGIGLSRAGALVTLLLPEGHNRLPADRAIRLLAEHYPGEIPAVQVGGDIPCCDILLATDPATAHRARQLERRARKAVYLLSPGEAVPSPSAIRGDRTMIAPSSGLTLLVADCGVADRPGTPEPERQYVVPAWVGRTPVPPRLPHVPTCILVAAAPGQPSGAREQATEALRQVRAAHPDLRIVLCGDLTDSETSGLEYKRLSALSGEGFERIVAERPICLVFALGVRPIWVYDLMAAGCPVIYSPWYGDRRHLDTETTEGIVTVPIDAVAIAHAVDSLLVDPVRLSALIQRSASLVRDMGNLRDTATFLLKILESARPAAHHDDERSESSGLLWPLAS
jgi:hypothetical protein